MDDLILDLHHPRVGAVVLSIRGKIGAVEGDAFEKMVDSLVHEKPDLVVLDVADLTYMGSRALGDMVRLQKAVKSGGGRVRLAAPREEIARLLELGRLDHLFPTFGSVQDALAYAGATL